MLAGFLAVLKIIGIVLLCILAFLLFVLLLVLFVPIRYRADALVPRTELDEGFDINSISASAAFSWLFFVARGKIEFPRNKEFTLRVFGIKILPKKEKKSPDEADDGSKEKETGDKKDSDDKKDQDVKDEGPSQNDEKGDNESSDSISDKEESSSAEGEAGDNGEASDKAEEGEAGAFDKADDNGESTENTADKADTDGADASEDSEDDDKSFLDVLWDIIDGIDNFLKTPISVLEKIQYTISRVCAKIDMIKATIENDIFKRAFDLVKTKLLKVIRMILPDRIDMDLLIGTGDPALTAELMGAYGALYPVLFKKVRFTPDFENRVVFLDAHIKGHITVFTIVYSAAVCYFNKDVKKTIRRFKKIVES